MVRLRLKRLGRTHTPFFRVSAMEARNPRDGLVLEDLGTYDPAHQDPARQVLINEDRVRYWLDKGAVPSDTVRQLLKRRGIVSR